MNNVRRGWAAALIATSAIGASAAAQGPCERWLPLGSGASAGVGTFQGVYNMALYDDDGPGPNPEQLIVGGSFSSLGGFQVPGLAKWDPRTTRWQSFGDGVAPPGGPIGGGFFIHDPDGEGPVSPQLFARNARWDPDARLWFPIETIGNSIGFGASFGLIGEYNEDGDPTTPLALIGGNFNCTMCQQGLYRWSPELHRWELYSPAPYSEYRVSGTVVFDFDGTGPEAPYVVISSWNWTPFVSSISRWRPGMPAWEQVPYIEPDRGVDRLYVFDSDLEGPAPAQLIALSGETIRVRDAATGAWSFLSGFPLHIGAIVGVVDFDGAGPDGSEFITWRSDRQPHGGYVAQLLRYNPITQTTREFAGGFVGPSPLELRSFVVQDTDGPGPLPPRFWLGGSFTESTDGVTMNSMATWVECGCPGDPDGDGVVGLSDLGMMIMNWSATSPPVPPFTSGDLSGDGLVTLEDLALVIANWGLVCQ